MNPLRERLSWIRLRRHCSFLPWLRLKGFRSSKPYHSLCHFKVRIWSYTTTRSLKTESVINPLPRSVVVPSLSDFAGNLSERLHCPVRGHSLLRHLHHGSVCSSPAILSWARQLWSGRSHSPNMIFGRKYALHHGMIIIRSTWPMMTKDAVYDLGGISELSFPLIFIMRKVLIT